MDVVLEWVEVWLAAEQAGMRAHARVLDAPGYAASLLPALFGAHFVLRDATA